MKQSGRFPFLVLTHLADIAGLTEAVGVLRRGVAVTAPGQAAALDTAAAPTVQTAGIDVNMIQFN